jgi:DNA-directed RNA polymerase specialized sigma24 family protein
MSNTPEQVMLRGMGLRQLINDFWPGPAGLKAMAVLIGLSGFEASTNDPEVQRITEIVGTTLALCLEALPNEQKEVLSFLALGETEEEIAASLSIEPERVRHVATNAKAELERLMRQTLSTSA